MKHRLIYAAIAAVFFAMCAFIIWNAVLEKAAEVGGKKEKEIDKNFDRIMNKNRIKKQAVKELTEQKASFEDVVDLVWQVETDTGGMEELKITMKTDDEKKACGKNVILWTDQYMLENKTPDREKRIKEFQEKLDRMGR